jgi:hypothetical protein
MKPTTRRLGRGLGAFLDFAPAGEDGAARVGEMIASAEATSVLETSAPRPPVRSAVVQVVATVVVTAPAPLSPAAPAPVAAPVERAPPPIAKAAPVAPVDEAPVLDDALFLDDVVVGLSFGDVELE